MKKNVLNLVFLSAFLFLAFGCTKSDDDSMSLQILSPPEVDINFIGHNTVWNFNAQININVNVEDKADFLYNYTVRIDNLTKGAVKSMNNYYGETDEGLYAGNQFSDGSSSGSHTCQFVADVSRGDTVVVSVEGECRVNTDDDIGFAESEIFILP
ncbi:MAG: hypothetical protein ACPGLV_18720 [Bacteroidia bacterium]